MRGLRVILCLSAAVTIGRSAPGLAQNPWLSLGDFGHPAYLDTTAVVRRSPAVAEVRVLLAGYTGPGYDRVETQEVNCRTRESRVLKVEDRQADERARGDVHAPPPDTVWHSFVPNSLGARLLGAVCAYLRGGRSHH
jgi:hypothetical protein